MTAPSDRRLQARRLARNQDRRRSSEPGASSPWNSWSPAFEWLEDRCVMSGGLPFTIGAATLPTDPSVQVSGTITRSGGQDLYQVTLDSQGLLIATVHAPGVDTLLSLEDAQGRVLIQSQASSPTDPDGRIAQHLESGTYFLSVSEMTGVGAFTLATSFTQATSPVQSLSESQGAYGVTTADINGDGKPDLIIPDYFDDQILINLGLGDGTFQPPVAVPVGIGPTEVLATHLFGDGHLDLVVVDQLSNDLTILRGDGQGNFTVSQVLTTQAGPVQVVAGDFTGDGLMDLAVADEAANGIEIFRNQGDGLFVESRFIGSISAPSALAVANLNDDGKPDLAVASSGSGNLVLFSGEGNDNFDELPYQLPVGPGCSDVIAANFSNSNWSDLAAVSPITGTISIFHFDGFAYRQVDLLQAGSTPESLVAADFNGDGKLDLAAVDYGSNQVSVFLSDGYENFGPASNFATGAGPTGLATADFNGDGSADLVTSDFIGLTISVLLNNGDATFISPPAQPPSAGPEDVIVADLTNNGIDDLVVPDLGLNEVEVFLGRGDGTFRAAIDIPAGSGPEDVTVGDFTGDGIDDLAVVDEFTNSLLILKGKGDGTFEPIQTLATGDGPQFVKTADLDGDGHLDLVVANYLGNSINLFYNQGDGTFAPAITVPVGIGPSGIAITDLNGDGRPDLAISDSGSDDVEVFLANGPRTYAAPISYPAGNQPWTVTAADFNKDGRPDLIVADSVSGPTVLSLLVNNGNGTFRPPEGFSVGGSPYPIAIGDFNGDGNLDVITGSDQSNNLSLLMGQGDGTFAPAVTLPGGTDPYGLAVGDFNGDGYLDVVAVNYESNNLSVYLGQGDGTFASPETIPLISPDLPTITAELEGNGVPQVLVANPEAGTISIFNSQGDGTLQLINTIDVGGSPSGMVVGDFNGDGRPDLAVTDASTDEVLIFLGLGNGTFESPVGYRVGQSPTSPIVGDFDGDGILDIAVADTNSNDVSVLYGRGDGTFGPARSIPVGKEPIALVIGGIGTGGLYDLGTVNRTSNNLSLLVGLPGGSFSAFDYNLPGITTSAVATGDYDGDGTSDIIFLDELTGTAYVELDYAGALSSGGNRYPVAVNLGLGPGNYLVKSADLYGNNQSDLILANLDTGVVTIFSGWSNQTFEHRSQFQSDVKIAGLTVADLNDDGLPDIMITQAGTGQIETYLSGGHGVFSPALSTVPLPHPSPLIFPGSKPGVTDIVNIDNSGQVLERFGISGITAEFGSPVNLTLGTDYSIRDDAIVKTGGDLDVALLLANQPTLYIQDTQNVTASGRFPISLPAEGNYTRVISGDLFGTGLDDIVVINRTLNVIVIIQQTSSGVFKPYGQPIPAGFGPTDVTLAWLTPGGLPDLVIADGSSGEVTLIDRTKGGGFAVGAMLPAGLATAGTVLLSGLTERTSPDEPVGVISGVFGPSGLTDVVVVDHGTNRISILQGLPDGGLSAPSLALTYSTGLDPIQVIAAPLTSNGLLDLVVLNEGSHDISIFLNNGHGGFVALPRVDAGDNPTSMTVSDVTGDGVPDLVVSNTSGDILILAGNGDGTFQPYERADATVSLAVGDLTGDGQNDFVLTNTSEDLLSVQTSTSSAGFLQGRGNGLLAPGPVAIADMNGDGIPDLIVTNTGGNDVLVYLGLGNGRFEAPQEFFTGTAPVGLTVADLTGNGRPDLIVANSGSNDITILLGTITADGSWTMVPGPRLKAGDHPVSTTVADLYGDGQQDILVVNQDSNDITVLRPLGGGFYDDSDPLTLPTGLSPVQAFVGHFSPSVEPGIVVLDSDSNNMTYYPNIGSPASRILSGGTDPVAGVMGDFNDDGFADLAVANYGDSRITLFHGGIFGLTLAQTISLGTSTRPTALVVSTLKGGDLQFFVGAEGEDHAIAVSISGIAITTIEVIVSPPTDGGIAGVSGLSHLATGTPFSPGEFNSAIFEPPGNVAVSTTQESASVSSNAGAPSGAVGTTSVIVTALTQAAQSLFSPSSRSLFGLLDNLFQLAQGQTAEILPLGKNEMAAVAVLLATSSMASHADERGSHPGPVPTEDDPAVVPWIADDQASPLPSPWDRFVANLGVDEVDLSDELVARPGRCPDFGSEWVWRRRSIDKWALTTPFDRDRDPNASPRIVDQGLELAELPHLDPVSPPDDPGMPADGVESSILSRIGLALASALALGIGFVCVRNLDRDALTNRFRRPDRPSPSGPTLIRMSEGSRFGSSNSSVKSRESEDLPPWLRGPKSPRYRHARSDRRFAASLFRKRGLDE